MKIEVRKLIYKIPVIHMLAWRMVDKGNLHFYKKYCTKTDNINQIKRLKNSKNGKRCFIIGNGPSLSVDDLEMLQNEDCFAANLIFKIFDKTIWRPDYYFIQDRYADTGDALNQLEAKHLFIGDYYWRKRGISNPNAVCFHAYRVYKESMLKFSTEIEKGIYDYCTITYSMIQAAVYMGYKEIYLIGMDHSYALTYDAQGNVIEDNSVKSHVFEDKNPKKVIANVEGMNKAYICAREFANNNGIKIVNCTRGGKLEWFPRVSLEEVLNNGK